MAAIFMTETRLPADGPYIDAVLAGRLHADRVYQRDLDKGRIARMAAAFDRRLLGVLEVSKRADGSYAILDGQHRHAAVLEADPLGHASPVVCQVYEGLTIEDEARLFHEINIGRKTLSWWDRWRARRGAAEAAVLAIDEVLAGQGLQINPAQVDGNIRATKALEIIVNDIGDLAMLESVLTVLTSAWGRSVDVFDGSIMQAVAHVLNNYEPDELDVARLIDRLREIPPRQLRARAGSLRELHRGTLPRLCAAVIVDRYNTRGGKRLEDFLARVPALAHPREIIRAREERRHRAEPAAVAPENIPQNIPTEPDRPAPPRVPSIPPTIDLDVCRCGHSKRRHDDGVCMVCDECSAYTNAAA